MNARLALLACALWAAAVGGACAEERPAGVGIQHMLFGPLPQNDTGNEVGPPALTGARDLARSYSAPLIDPVAAFEPWKSMPQSPEPGLKLLLRRDRPDVSSPRGIDEALQLAALPYAVESRDLAVDWELGLVAPSARSGLGLDVGFVPRASFGVGDYGRSRGAGAKVALGRFLNVGEDTPKSWYLFAAADGTQVTWDLDQRGVSSLAPDMNVGERVVVGDVQAGISIARFGGQLGFAYTQRDISYKDASRSEQFAAFSFSMKR